MIEMIEANWLAFVLALLIGLVVAFWLFGRATRKPDQRERPSDVLDEGAEPAKRNQALIDSPPAAPIVPPAGTGTMAGAGEVIAAGAQEEVSNAEARQEEETAKKEAEPLSAAPPAPDGPTGDDLSKLKGVGPKLVSLLQSLGITRYEQIASWSEEDIDRIDAQLGSFTGRIRRDNWVEQAKYLSGGDVAGYEAKFGKL